MNDGPTDLLVKFVNPYYTSAVRHYVSVPFLTGERVELWTKDGDMLASVDEPGNNWAAIFAHSPRCMAYTAEEIEQADQEEVHE